jgi:hypothetical protein
MAIATDAKFMERLTAFLRSDAFGEYVAGRLRETVQQDRRLMAWAPRSPADETAPVTPRKSAPR